MRSLLNAHPDSLTRVRASQIQDIVEKMTNKISPMEAMHLSSRFCSIAATNREVWHLTAGTALH